MADEKDTKKKADDKAAAEEAEARAGEHREEDGRLRGQAEAEAHPRYGEGEVRRQADGAGSPPCGPQGGGQAGGGDEADRPAGGREAGGEGAREAPSRGPQEGDAAGAGPPRPVVTARAKYVRSSARKARLVMDHVRGKPIAEARALLRHSPRGVARDLDVCSRRRWPTPRTTTTSSATTSTSRRSTRTRARR